MKLRTKILLKILNNHELKMTKMEIIELRNYFEKITRAGKKPTLKSISEQKTDKGINVRQYIPRRAKKRLIIYFHGGGFVLGSLDSHDNVARLFSRYAHSIVVSVDYTLAPEGLYPTGVNDASSATEWAINNYSRQGYEIFMAGDSAGAHIALYAYLGLKPSLQKEVSGIIMVYPALDPGLESNSAHELSIGHFITRADMKMFWQIYLNDQTVDWPLSHSDLASLPPLLIQTAGYDLLRDDGKQLADAVSANGGKVRYINYPWATHGFLHVPSWLSGRNKALRDISRFVVKTKRQ